MYRTVRHRTRVVKYCTVQYRNVQYYSMLQRCHQWQTQSGPGRDRRGEAEPNIIWLTGNTNIQDIHARKKERKMVTPPVKNAQRVACIRGCTDGPAMWGGQCPLALCRPDSHAPYHRSPLGSLPPEFPYPKVAFLQKTLGLTLTLPLPPDSLTSNSVTS